MTASTVPHRTAHRPAAHPAVRPAARRGLTVVPEVRPHSPAGLPRELDCEDGCHYCQGPETD